MRARRAWTRVWNVAGRASLRTKIVGIPAVLMLSLGLVVALGVRREFESKLTRHVQREGMSLAHNIAERSTDLILTGDLFGLYRLVNDTLADNPAVRYAFLVGADGAPVASSFPSGVPERILSLNRLPVRGGSSIQGIETEEGLIWDVAVAGPSGGPEVVRIGMSGRQVAQDVAAITRKILLATAVALVLSIIAAYAIATILARPVRELVSAAQRVGAGDFTPHVRVWAADEVGELTEAFNVMTSDLKLSADEIARRHRELEEKEAVRRMLLERLVHAQEEERRRVSLELHDRAGQSISSLMLGLKGLETAHDAATIRRQVGEMESLAASTLEELRHLAWELRPAALDDLGLVPALRRYAREFGSRLGIPVDFEAGGLDGTRLPLEAETVVYRVVQEGLTNVARHAHASRVSVLLTRRDGELLAIVEDDGTGFDPLAVGRPDSPSLGLVGMEERAVIVGGSLTVESTPGGGTTIYLLVPIPETQGPEDCDV